MTGMTLGSALGEAQRRIAAVDARVLLCHSMRADLAYLIAHADATLEPTRHARFVELVERRAAGEPVAYLTGEREFFGRVFRVTPDVLIPRPETELLVELALERLGGNGELRVLDMGTGSGCVGLTIVSECSHVNLTLCDQSLASLEIARDNARRLELTEVKFVASDWFGRLADTRYDLIVSNPPYIADLDTHLSQGDLRFEPRGALAAGPDGLDCIRSIVSGAGDHLVPGGWLLLEHGHDQAAAVRALLQTAGFANVFSARDLAGIERVSGGVLTASIGDR